MSVLNISGNNLDETSDLRVLRRLNHLMIEDNELEDWAELSETLFQWKALNKLEISGNPICHHKKYRDKLIIMSKSLGMKHFFLYRVRSRYYYIRVFAFLVSLSNRKLVRIGILE